MPNTSGDVTGGPFVFDTSCSIARAKRGRDRPFVRLRSLRSFVVNSAVFIRSVRLSLDHASPAYLESTGVGLTGAARNEEHCHEGQRRVYGHHQKERPIAAVEIEQAAVQWIANRAA